MQFIGPNTIILIVLVTIAR